MRNRCVIRSNVITLVRSGAAEASALLWVLVQQTSGEEFVRNELLYGQELSLFFGNPHAVWILRLHSWWGICLLPGLVTDIVTIDLQQRRIALLLPAARH